jgi:hypothetical protein
MRSVQRILEAHQLAPHRIRAFKLLKDFKFAEKLRDVVGLYVNPPAHAIVLSERRDQPSRLLTPTTTAVDSPMTNAAEHDCSGPSRRRS